MSPLIRRLQEADLAAVQSIQSSASEASHWRVEEYLDQQSWVIEWEGEVAGFAVCRCLVEAQTVCAEYELLNLAITPSSRGRGLGKALLRQVLDACQGQWFLEVRESNQVAIRLYAALGFREIRRRRNYYSHPAEDAIEMTKLS